MLDLQLEYCALTSKSKYSFSDISKMFYVQFITTIIGMQCNTNHQKPQLTFMGFILNVAFFPVYFAWI